MNNRHDNPYFELIVDILGDHNPNWKKGLENREKTINTYNQKIQELENKIEKYQAQLDRDITNEKAKIDNATKILEEKVLKEFSKNPDTKKMNKLINAMDKLALAKENAVKKAKGNVKKIQKIELNYAKKLDPLRQEIDEIEENNLAIQTQITKEFERLNTEKNNEIAKMWVDFGDTNKNQLEISNLIEKVNQLKSEEKEKIQSLNKKYDLQTADKYSQQLLTAFNFDKDLLKSFTEWHDNKKTSKGKSHYSALDNFITLIEAGNTLEKAENLKKEQIERLTKLAESLKKPDRKEQEPMVNATSSQGASLLQSLQNQGATLRRTSSNAGRPLPQPPSRRASVNNDNTSPSQSKPLQSQGATLRRTSSNAGRPLPQPPSRRASVNNDTPSLLANEAKPSQSGMFSAKQDPSLLEQIRQGTALKSAKDRPVEEKSKSALEETLGSRRRAVEGTELDKSEEWDEEPSPSSPKPGKHNE